MLFITITKMLNPPKMLLSRTGVARRIAQENRNLIQTNNVH